ncbi:uncharacterized protein LOC113213365 isoform X2 [Frankliniella occidentalis]|nr:uncharacterized protein LOC113213365 isoform X2 [Frankliniella occidentalis]
MSALASLLLQHSEVIRPSSSSTKFRRGFSHFLIGKWSLVLTVIFAARWSVEVLLASNSETRRVPILLLSGSLVCPLFIRFLARRRDDVGNIMINLSSISAFMEEFGCHSTQVFLSTTARFLNGMRRFYTGFAMVQFFGVMHTTYGYRDVSPIVALLTSVSPLLAWLLYVVNTLGVMCALAAFYETQTYVFLLFSSCAFLWRALGVECEQGGKASSLKSCTEIHAGLVSSARYLRGLLASLVAQWTCTVLLLPFKATVDLITDFRVDIVALTCFTDILTMFLPACLVGQALRDSTESLRTGLYFAPWLEESGRARRDRARFMLGADCKPRLVALSGLLTFNAPFFLDVIHHWFGILNVFLSLHSNKANL